MKPLSQKPSHGFALILQPYEETFRKEFGPELIVVNQCRNRQEHPVIPLVGRRE